MSTHCWKHDITLDMSPWRNLYLELHICHTSPWWLKSVLIWYQNEKKCSMVKRVYSYSLDSTERRWEASVTVPGWKEVEVWTLALQLCEGLVLFWNTMFNCLLNHCFVKMASCESRYKPQCAIVHCIVQCNMQCNALQCHVQLCWSMEASIHLQNAKGFFGLYADWFWYADW